MVTTKTVRWMIETLDVRGIPHFPVSVVCCVTDKVLCAHSGCCAGSLCLLLRCLTVCSRMGLRGTGHMRVLAPIERTCVEALASNPTRDWAFEPNNEAHQENSRKLRSDLRVATLFGSCRAPSTSIPVFCLHKRTNADPEHARGMMNVRDHGLPI